MKTKYLPYETIRGEFPQSIPSTHILVQATSIGGEGTCESYFLVPKQLWEDFSRLRTQLEQEAELVYEVDEHYSPPTSVVKAIPYPMD